MTIRKAIKAGLFSVSPRLGMKCEEVWDAFTTVVRVRMTVRAASKYIIFGICPGLAGRFSYFGTRVYFPNASAVFRLACEKGIYEPDVTGWLCRLAQPSHLFIDIGANIGLTSIPVLRTVKGARVLSFEPSPNSLPYLERTWSESDFKNRWEIVPKAAGESAGTVQFCVGAARNGGSTD